MFSWNLPSAQAHGPALAELHNHRTASRYTALACPYMLLRITLVCLECGKLLQCNRPSQRITAIQNSGFG